MDEQTNLDFVTRPIIGAAIEDHRTLGPALLESAYQACSTFELRQLGLQAEEQKALPVVYKEVHLDCGYRMDLVVNDSVTVEIKTVEQLAPIHEAQLLSYLRPKDVGLLFDFHRRMLKDEMKRIVNEFADSTFLAYSAVNKN